jgi:hypothetical protein
VTVFLSYAREDNRLAETLAAHLSALGLNILAFEDVELVEDTFDYLRECRSVCVLYSANSRITHSVRLANRMTKRSLSGIVFIDEDWDAEPKSLDVFGSFFRHRARFDYLSITKALKAIVGLWSRTGMPSKAIEEDFHALIVDPRTERLSQKLSSISGQNITSEDLVRQLRAILQAELSIESKRHPGISGLLAQTGRKLWKPPGDPPDDYVVGGMRALLQAIDARQPRVLAPPAQPGDSAGGAADLGGQDGGSAPPSPPTPTTDGKA